MKQNAIEILWAKATENFRYNHCPKDGEHCHLWGKDDVSCPCVATWAEIWKSKDEKTYYQITKILNEYFCDEKTKKEEK